MDSPYSNSIEMQVFTPHWIQSYLVCLFAFCNTLGFAQWAGGPASTRFRNLLVSVCKEAKSIVWSQLVFVGFFFLLLKDLFFFFIISHFIVLLYSFPNQRQCSQSACFFWPTVHIPNVVSLKMIWNQQWNVTIVSTLTKALYFGTILRHLDFTSVFPFSAIFRLWLNTYWRHILYFYASIFIL